MVIVLTPRARLLNFMREQLGSLKSKDSPHAAALRLLLSQAEEGLVALIYGETQQIFAPSDKKGSKDGTKP